MNKYISTILIFFVIILFSSCGNNQAEEDITDTVGNVSEGGQCETDAECADELICDNNECVDSDGDSLPPPPPNSTCYIGGTLTLPDSVDATGVPYKVAIDTDTEFNLDEVTSTAENWSSGNIQEYTISIDDISQGSYYIYAMLSVGDENYIGYFGEIDANSPPDANASISCNAVFDITLEATTIDIPDIIIPKRAIAVGSAGEILYSDDFGVTWYLANSGTNSILRAASQGAAGRWVVVGYDGTIIYSDDDGTNWNAANSGTTNRLNGVASFGTDGFIAVGEPANFDPYGITRSIDGGLTWTPRPTFVTLHDLTVRGTNDLAAVGHTYSSYEGYVMLTYTGGEQWGSYYLQSKPPLYDVEYTLASTFVAVGQLQSLYSFNGGTWYVGATHPEIPTTMYGVAWSNPPGRLVAVGQQGVVIYGGATGTNWTEVDSGTDKILYDVATDGDGRFIAVGYDGTIIYSHDAGITWDQANSGTNEILWGVAFAK